MPQGIASFCAATLRKAHALLEFGRTVGKVVVETF